MKIKVEKSIITAALSKVASIAPSRSTLPILQNIKLGAYGDTLRITASDTEINATIEIPASVEEQGETTVPAAALLDICKKAASDSVALTADGLKATLSGGRSRFTLGTLPAEDYPHDMAIKPDAHAITMKAAELHNLMEKTAFCSSTEETRHYLGGVYLHGGDDGLHAAATDGNRLAHLSMEGLAVSHPVILPRKVVPHLAKMFDGAEDVEIRTSDNLIEFKTDRLTVTSKVVDGTFPDYVRIMPKTFERTFKTQGETLRQAIDRVSVARDQNTNATRLALSGTVLTVSARSKGDDATDEVDIVYDGEDFVLSVNATYLMDTLRACGDDMVTFQMNGEKDPIRVTAECQSNVEWIVMPMKG
jgi:DNA polymerase-3 subunit beta